jgi:hypothetical protein
MENKDSGNIYCFFTTDENNNKIVFNLHQKYKMKYITITVILQSNIFSQNVRIQCKQLILLAHKATRIP